MTPSGGGMTVTPGMGQDGGQPLQPGVPNQQLPPQGPQQQFGLSGAENALFGGANAASNAFQQGAQRGVGTLLAGFDRSNQFLNQGQNALGGNFNAQASNVDPMTGQPLFNQAAQGVNQFTGAGLQAQNQAAALSGSQGQAAFDAAMLNNPNQNFLNQRGQEALINARAATGGLGSPQLQMELQQLGQAQAGQQLQQQFQNNMALSGQGLQAAGMGGQFQAQAGQQQGNLANQNASRQTQVSQGNAANQLGAARARAGLSGQGAGIAAQLASQGAGFQNQAGRDIGSLLAGTAGQVATGRLQAGRDIAGNVASTTTGLSGLQNQEGQSLSDLLGSFGNNAGNLLTGAGGAASNSQSQLAALLANLATGQGTQGSNIALQGGQTGANLANAQGANQQELISNLLRSSQLGSPAPAVGSGNTAADFSSPAFAAWLAQQGGG
jgi:hypothetical protein